MGATFQQKKKLYIITPDTTKDRHREEKLKEPKIEEKEEGKEEINENDEATTTKQVKNGTVRKPQLAIIPSTPISPSQKEGENKEKEEIPSSSLTKTTTKEGTNKPEVDILGTLNTTKREKDNQLSPLPFMASPFSIKPGQHNKSKEKERHTNKENTSSEEHKKLKKSPQSTTRKANRMEYLELAAFLSQFEKTSPNSDNAIVQETDNFRDSFVDAEAPQIKQHITMKLAQYRITIGRRRELSRKPHPFAKVDSFLSNIHSSPLTHQEEFDFTDIGGQHPHHPKYSSTQDLEALVTRRKNHFSKHQSESNLNDLGYHPVSDNESINGPRSGPISKSNVTHFQYVLLKNNAPLDIQVITSMKNKLVSLIQNKFQLPKEHIQNYILQYNKEKNQIIAEEMYSHMPRKSRHADEEKESFPNFKNVEPIDEDDEDDDIIEQPQKPTPYQRLVKLIQSRFYFIVTILFTVLAVSMSMAVKLFDYLEDLERVNNPTVDTTARKVYDVIGVILASIYIVMQVIMCLEMTARIFILNKRFFYNPQLGRTYFTRLNWLSIIDCLIVYGDAILTLILIILWYVKVDIDPIENVGIILAIRLGVFMLYNEKLAETMRGMIDSVTNFIMAIFFMFIIVYLGGVCAYLLYKSKCTAILESDPTNSFCIRFSDYYQSVFSMYQIMTSESWSEEFARPAENILTASYAFFGIYHVATTYVLLNVIAALIVDSIMSRATPFKQKATLQRLTSQQRLSNNSAEERLILLQSKMERVLEECAQMRELLSKKE